MLVTNRVRVCGSTVSRKCRTPEPAVFRPLSDVLTESRSLRVPMSQSAAPCV